MIDIPSTYRTMYAIKDLLTASHTMDSQRLNELVERLKRQAIAVKVATAQTKEEHQSEVLFNLARQIQEVLVLFESKKTIPAATKAVRATQTIAHENTTDPVQAPGKIP